MPSSRSPSCDPLAPSSANHEVERNSLNSGDEFDLGLAAARREVADREAENVGLRGALGAAHQQLRAREAELADLTTRLAIANATTHARQEEINALGGRYSGAEEKFSAVEHELQLMRDKRQRAVELAEKRESKIGNLRATRSALEETLKARDRVIMARDEELGASRQELQAHRDRISAHQKSIANRDAEMALLSDQLLSSQEHARTLEAEIGGRERVVAHQRDKLAQRDEQLASLLATLDVVERTLATRPSVPDLSHAAVPNPHEQGPDEPRAAPIQSAQAAPMTPHLREEMSRSPASTNGEMEPPAAGFQSRALESCDAAPSSVAADELLPSPDTDAVAFESNLVDPADHESNDEQENPAEDVAEEPLLEEPAVEAQSVVDSSVADPVPEDGDPEGLVDTEGGPEVGDNVDSDVDSDVDNKDGNENNDTDDREEDVASEPSQPQSPLENSSETEATSEDEALAGSDEEVERPEDDPAQSDEGQPVISAAAFEQELRVLDASGDLFTQRPAAPPAIFGWWRDHQIATRVPSPEINSFDDLLVSFIARECDAHSQQTISIWSLCGADALLELRVARALVAAGHANFVIDCFDDRLSWHEIRADLAEADGLSDQIDSLPASLAGLKEEQQYDVFIADGSLALVADLPGLFEWIQKAWKDESIMLLGALLGEGAGGASPENVETIDRIWSVMSDRYMHNHITGDEQTTFTAASSGGNSSGNGGPLSPGATPLLPLLLDSFCFEVFAPFGNLINAFVGPEIGPNFDPAEESDCSFIERFAKLDEAQIDAGVIHPIHMTAVLRSSSVPDAILLENRAPERCLMLND